jgi:hypothetical protein
MDIYILYSIHNKASIKTTFKVMHDHFHHCMPPFHICTYTQQLYSTSGWRHSPSEEQYITKRGGGLRVHWWLYGSTRRNGP